MKPKKDFSITFIISYIILLLSDVLCESDLADFEFNESPTLSQLDDVYDDMLENTKMHFDEFSPDQYENSKQNNLFDGKEKYLREALTKALTNKGLRQRFVEVIPILKVLSTEQRFALSALISAQINAKPGTELKLDQVKALFGDSKKLILPLIFDIANLVRTAAKNSIHHEILHQIKPKINQLHINRRDFELLDDDDDDDNEMIGVIDAKEINHELFTTAERVSKNKKNEIELPLMKRSKRSANYQILNQFTHFMNALTNTTNERSLHDRKLNLTSFSSPVNNDEINTKSDIIENDNEPLHLTFEQVEDLSFGDLNGTILELNKSLENSTQDEILEELPTPESLIAGPRIRKTNNNRLSNGVHRKSSLKRGGPIRPKFNVVPNCERFTASMCLRTDDYPTELIMGSIRRHKHAMSALLAEYRDKSAELEYQEYLEELQMNKKRRQDQHGVTPGGMCATIVRYARPQKARSATGEWKFIVNTGQHTQTLRIEKCSHPGESCSYLSDNYRSRCIQVYNYHRLLSWDKSRGLHVDIFKIPTCCNCHVDGYRETFPPLGGSPSSKDFSPAVQNYNTINNEYNTLNDDIEYDDDDEVEEQESVAYQFADGFKRVKPPSHKYDDFLQLSSSNYVKNRYEKPTSMKTPPTIGSFLSPPRSSSLDPVKFFNSLKRQRQPILFDIEDRSDQIDQDSAGSDVGKEVTVYSTTIKSPKLNSKNRSSNSSVRYTSPYPGIYKDPNNISTTVSPKSTNKNYRGNSGLFKPSQPIKYTPTKSFADTTTATAATAATSGTTETSKISTTLPIQKKTNYSTKFASATTKFTNINSVSTEMPFDINNHKISYTNFNRNQNNNNNKRINYNYHPIIEFFEVSSLSPSALPIDSYNRRHATRRNFIKDRRMGLSSETNLSADVNDNNWRPLISHL